MTSHIEAAPQTTAPELDPQDGDATDANTQGRGPRREKDRGITVTVNGTPLVLMDRKITGADLKTKAGIPSDYELYIVHGNATKVVADADLLNLHDGSAFRAIPAGTFGCVRGAVNFVVCPPMAGAH
ncbi:multiubiquitin domain-containing protein [Gemmatimonas sp.]|uniref:multiubiquitin domain-containing protein n=1 Tax=Gemmatimonas sp. TaxID=1962908 RepID=UPI00286BD57F|nr:multiubiquitin domain-containing protein [Gemmatimonas sp.]